MKIKKILSTLIILLSFNSIWMTSVYAGARDNSKSVSIYSNPDGSGRFSGSFGLARNSADSNQVLGCSSYGHGMVAKCSGIDNTGRIMSCGTDKNGLIDQIKSMTDSSSITVEVDNRGNCTSIVVTKSSIYQPK